MHQQSGGHFLSGKYSQGAIKTATGDLTSHVPVGDRGKGTPMLGVDVVDMFGATQARTAIGYLTTELERIRCREHVVDMPGPR